MSRFTGKGLTKGSDLRNEKVIAKGASLSLVGMVAWSGLSYLLAMVIARGLGSSVYGLFSLGLASINLTRPLVMLGLNHGSLRYVARYRALGDPASETRLARRVLILVAIWGGVVSAAIALLAEPIARLSGQDVAATTSLLRQFAPAVLLSAALYVLAGISEGQKQIGFGVLARDILQPASALVLVGGALWLGAGVGGVVLGYVASIAVALLAIVWLLRATLAPSMGSRGSPAVFSLREVVGFSLPFFPMTFLREAGNRLEIYLLAFLGTSEQVGLFSAAASTAVLVIFGLKAIWRIYAAVASELHARDEMDQLEHVLQLATRWSVTVSLPAVIALGLFGTDVLSLFGSGFATANSVLLILVVGQFINALTGPAPTTLMIAGYSSLILFNNIFTVVLNIGLDWWLISLWGITGAAIGSAVAVAALNVISLVEVRLLLGISCYNRAMIRPVLAGVLTFFATWPTLTLLHGFPSLLRLIVGIALVGLVFLALFWILASGDDRSMMALAWSRIKRFLVSFRPGRTVVGD